MLTTLISFIGWWKSTLQMYCQIVKYIWQSTSIYPKLIRVSQFHSGEPFMSHSQSMWFAMGCLTHSGHKDVKWLGPRGMFSNGLMSHISSSVNEIIWGLLGKENIIFSHRTKTWEHVKYVVARIVCLKMDPTQRM